MADVPLLPEDEEKAVLKMVGISSLGRDEVEDVSDSKRPEVVGCEVVLAADALSGDCVFEWEEGVKLSEGVKGTVVYESGIAVDVVPEKRGGGWVVVRKVVRADMSVTEREVVLSGREYVVEMGKVT